MDTLYSGFTFVQEIDSTWFGLALKEAQHQMKVYGKILIDKTSNVPVPQDIDYWYL